MTSILIIDISEFCKFILGDDMQPETEGTDPCRVRKRLIERCNHLSEEVRVFFKKRLVNLEVALPINSGCEERGEV